MKYSVYNEKNKYQFSTNDLTKAKNDVYEFGGTVISEDGEAILMIGTTEEDVKSILTMTPQI